MERRGLSVYLGTILFVPHKITPASADARSDGEPHFDERSSTGIGTILFVRPRYNFVRPTSVQFCSFLTKSLGRRGQNHSAGEDKITPASADRRPAGRCLKTGKSARNNFFVNRSFPLKESRQCEYVLLPQSNRSTMDPSLRHISDNGLSARAMG